MRRKEKRVAGVEQSVPFKLCVTGVSGKSKSYLGLGYTGTIRCHWLSCHVIGIDVTGRHVMSLASGVTCHWLTEKRKERVPMGSIKNVSSNI